MPVANVAPTAVVGRCANRIISRVIAPIIPLPVITPPKHIAQRISQIVLSIPPIPLVDTRSFRAAFPVSMAVSLPQVIRMARIAAKSPPLLIVSTICGCAISIAITAITTVAKSVMSAGNRRDINMAVSRGTINTHGVMLNDDASAAEKASVLTAVM